MRAWFARTFPMLSKVDAGTWMMLPVGMVITVGLVVGFVYSLQENPGEFEAGRRTHWSVR